MSTQFTGQPTRPYRAGAYVNAGSSCDIDYSIRDEDNELATPSLLEYRIDNLTDSEIVATWTTIPGATSEGSLTISAALNEMSTQYREQQLNQVTFRATFANGKKIVSTCVYTLCAIIVGGS